MHSVERQLFFSDQFVISCGTVSIDVQRRKVLLIRLRATGEHMLPKGRKDVGERLEDAAMRETFEETGFRVKLRPTTVPTLATLPLGLERRPTAATEPIAMTQRTNTQGHLKIIFWFIAEADSTDTQEEGTQQESEDFDTVWSDVDQVASVLSWDDDRRVAQAAIKTICTVVS